MEKIFTRFLILLFLFTSTVLCSQPFSKVLYASNQKNEVLNDMVVLSNGKLAAAGSVDRNGKKYGLFLLIDPYSNIRPASIVFDKYEASAFYSIAQDSLDRIILVGEKKGASFAIRLDPRGTSEELPSGQCGNKRFQKVFRTKNGDLIAAMAKDSVYLCRLQNNEFKPFSSFKGDSDNVISIESEPISDGFWVCGNKKGDIWVKHFKADGKQDITNLKIIGDSDISEQGIASSIDLDGTLLLTGKSQNGQGHWSTWFSYASLNGQKNQYQKWIVALKDCYGQAVCRSPVDDSIYVWSSQNGNNGEILSFSNYGDNVKIATATDVSYKFKPIVMRATPDGQIIVAGNEEGQIKILQWKPDIKPDVKKGRPKFKFGAPVLFSGGVKARLENDERALLSIPLINIGNAESGPLIVSVSVTNEGKLDGLPVIVDTLLHIYPIRANDSLNIRIALQSNRKIGNGTANVKIMVREHGLYVFDATLSINCGTQDSQGDKIIYSNSEKDENNIKNKQENSEDYRIVFNKRGKNENTTKYIETIEFTITAKESDIKDQKIEVYINSSKCPRSITKQKSVESKCYNGYFTVELDTTVRVQIKYKGASSEIIFIKKVPKKRKLFVLSIGVDGGRLTKSVASANAFLKAVKEASNTGGFFDTVFVYDQFVEKPQDATRQLIIDVIGNIAEKIRGLCNNDECPECYFYFFFSGHGEVEKKEQKLLPYDANTSNTNKTRYLNYDTDILALMDNIKHVKRFLFLDICRTVEAKDGGFSSSSYDRINIENEPTTFYACQPGKEAVECGGDTTPFTTSLVEIITGKGKSRDKDITICAKDIGDYLIKKVPDLVKDKCNGFEQQPIVIYPNEDSQTTPMFKIQKYIKE